MPHKNPIQQKEYQREYYQKNKEQLRPIHARNKKLRYQADPEKGREEVRKWRRNNPEKSAECNRRWHRENKERVKEWRDANPDKVKAARKRRYDKNPEREKAKSKKWQRENPVRFWVISSLSNHRAKGYVINITLNDLTARAEETKACAYCGRKIIFQRGKGQNGGSPTLDRINNEKTINKDNVQIICHLCNSSKSSRTHQEFIDYCGQVYGRYER